MSNDNSNNNGMIRIGGLWRNEPKGGGKPYLAGSFGGARLMVFPNGYKQSDSDPDYVVCLAQSQTKGRKEAIKDELPKSNDFGI